MPLLRFPIEKQPKYKAYLLFTTLVRTPPSYNVQQAIPLLGKLLSGDTQLNNEEVYDDRILRVERERKSLQNKAVNDFLYQPTKETEKSTQIALYMPTPIQIQDGVSISSTDLGVLGVTGQESIEQGASLVSTVTSGAGAVVKSVSDAVKGNITADGARLVGAQMAAMIPGAATTDVIRGTLRTTPNPNTRMMFRSVNLRNFSFDFRMVPTSQRESEVIKNIITYFREELYPDVITLEGQAGGQIEAGYKFPNLFKIDFMYEDEDGNQKDLSEKNPNLKLNPMYLQAFTANYNSTGGFYKDRNFNDVQITMSFAEERTLSKKDIVPDKLTAEEFRAREATYAQ